MYLCLNIMICTALTLSLTKETSLLIIQGPRVSRSRIISGPTLVLLARSIFLSMCTKSLQPFPFPIFLLLGRLSSLSLYLHFSHSRTVPPHSPFTRLYTLLGAPFLLRWRSSPQCSLQRSIPNSGPSSGATCLSQPAKVDQYLKEGVKPKKKEEDRKAHTGRAYSLTAAASSLFSIAFI